MFVSSHVAGPGIQFKLIDLANERLNETRYLT